MKKLLIASANAHKIKELRDLLSDTPFEILSTTDVGFTEEIAETGNTYAENATLKAELLGKRYGHITIADDSGLEVDALEGRPGMYSARYAPGTDQDRINALLKELVAVPEEKRTARYRAVIAVYNPAEDATKIFEGACEGRILTGSHGVHGFGYDPIFFSTDLQKTFGEASEQEKQRVSHRARALRESKIYLSALV